MKTAIALSSVPALSTGGAFAQELNILTGVTTPTPS